MPDNDPAQAFGAAFHGARVLVTGHTGFKGAWLCEWLLALGAEVFGIALEPDTHPSLFIQLRLAERMHHSIGDVRDPAAVRAVVERARPEFVLHLAAQPLVRRSYAIPTETFATNVLGTAYVLDAIRLAPRPACPVVCVTTDKCYENREWVHAYREEDRLGGHDPYSASKAAAEIVVASFRQSFPATRVASARAGNVLGGGDWAEDRLVPDVVRAIRAGRPVPVRNPAAVRPWQHVLEPLSGYLWLAARLGAGDPATADAFNFGPAPASAGRVRELVEALLARLGGTWEDRSDPAAPHEASRLALAIDKAREVLGWIPAWDFAQTLDATARGYAADDVPALLHSQITAYTAAARAIGSAWARSSVP